MCQQLPKFLCTHTHPFLLSLPAKCHSVLKSSPTGLIIGPLSILAQPAESLKQPDVLGLQLFDQTLGGALVHHGSVQDALCPKEKRVVRKQ